MKADLTDYNVTPLRKVLAAYPQDYLSKTLSSFSCERDKDVESFLKDKAIMYEKRHLSRTYLMFAENETRDLDAYFTVAVSSMDVSSLECSNELRKKMNINDGFAQSYLIGQLGKRDGSPSGLGRSALLCAMEVIKGANLKAGCRVVTLDCKPSLVKYYADNGFADVGKNEKNGLRRMARIISTDAAVPQ